MTPEMCLQQLAKSGAIINYNDGLLQVSHPRYALPDSIITTLRAHKSALIELLLAERHSNHEEHRLMRAALSGYDDDLAAIFYELERVLTPAHIPLLDKVGIAFDRLSRLERPHP